MSTQDLTPFDEATHRSAVQAIVAAHAQSLALTPDATDGAASSSASFNSSSPVYQAAKQACTLMGFVEHDAECIANAWQRMATRSGGFNPALWPSHAADFGMQPWPRASSFAACPKQLGLYAVLPDAAWVARMAKAGVPTVQLRFKSDDAAAVQREVQAAVKAVKGTGALLFINDHWQAAIEAGAYGVHLGQEDLDTADLPAIRNAGLRLGLSTHGYAEMLKADAWSPSYIAMGAVYPTTLKRMMTAPQGPGRLRAYAQLMQRYPLVGIGGIDAARMPDVLASGVGSIAVVRALVAAEDPEATAQSLQAQIKLHAAAQ